jgi:hypothetical protein
LETLKEMRMSKVMSFCCAVLLTAAAGACGKDDPITAIDRGTDCAQICDKYKECFMSDYNVDDCTDSCTDMTDEDATDRIDDCENCLDDTSCTETPGCTTECVGLIPFST